MFNIWLDNEASLQRSDSVPKVITNIQIRVGRIDVDLIKVDGFAGYYIEVGESQIFRYFWIYVNLKIMIQYSANFTENFPIAFRINRNKKDLCVKVI